jgi:hypothetical protein
MTTGCGGSAPGSESVPPAEHTFADQHHHTCHDATTLAHWRIWEEIRIAKEYTAQMRLKEDRQNHDTLMAPVSSWQGGVEWVGGHDGILTTKLCATPMRTRVHFFQLRVDVSAPIQLTTIPTQSGKDFGIALVETSIITASPQVIQPAIIASHGTASSIQEHQQDRAAVLQSSGSGRQSSAPLTADESGAFAAARSLMHGGLVSPPCNQVPDERDARLDAKRKRGDDELNGVVHPRQVAAPMHKRQAVAAIQRYADGTMEDTKCMFSSMTDAELQAAEAEIFSKQRTKGGGSSSSGAAPVATVAVVPPVRYDEHDFLVTEARRDSDPDTVVPVEALPSLDPAVENSAGLAKSLKNSRPFVHEVLYMERLQQTFNFQEPSWVPQIFALGDTELQRKELDKLLEPRLLRKMRLWWGFGDDLHAYLYEMLIDRRFWHMKSEIFLDKMMQEMMLTQRQRVSDGSKAGCTDHWVVVLGCSGICVAMLCLQEVVAIIQKRFIGSFVPQILEVWLYEILPAALRVGNKVMAILSKDVRIVYKGDIENFPNDVDELLLFPDSVKFICLGSTECNNVSFANSKVLPVGTSGLHGDKSRTYFPWHRGLKKLADGTCSSRMVVMSELPKMKDKADEELMDRQLGKATHVEASDWNHNASRHRCIRSSPVVRLNVYKPYHVPAGKPNDIMADGSSWYPTKEAYDASPEKAPVTLRRYWTRLIVRHSIENDTNLSKYEKLSLSSLRVRFQSGEIRYAGVVFFLHHLGLSQTVLSGIQQDYPCEGIINSFGQKGEGENHFACGVKRLCGKCEAAIQLLGACWHFPSCTEALATMLIPAVLWWQSKPGAAKPDFWQFTEPAHVCDEACKQRPPR